MSSHSNSTTRSSDVKVPTNKSKNKKEEEQEQVELPKAIDYLFEKELINKQNKHIHIMETFGPSKKAHYLCTKFYARHEHIMPQNVATFLPFAYGSSCKHDTEATVYGWMPKKINRTELLKDLNFINAPKQRCCLTVYGEKLEGDKVNARPSFNGLKFFLQ